MSPRAKQQLYHSLAQLLRAGIPFPKALEKLNATARGTTRTVIARIRRELAAGRTVSEACAEAQPMIGAMEAAVLTAVERAGSLDRGLEQLAEYFEALTAARGTMLAKAAYPIFMLVLGVLLLNLPKLINENTAAYLRATLGLLGGVAAGIWLIYVLWKMISAMATFSPLADGFIRLLPMIGGMQRAFAMSRFCLAYDLQLEAGINTIDALSSSAMASRSGLVRRAVRSVLPEVLGGAQVGPLLAVSQAFDQEVVQGIMVGEESGQLDLQLQRLAAEQRKKAFGRLAALADWLPKLLYLGILLYLGWMIISIYQGYLGQVQSLIDQ
jgi:type II secretory pathway component PulF